MAGGSPSAGERRQARYHRRVRRLLTWLVITLGIAALVRRLRGKREEKALEAEASEADPAAELRRKLAENRAAVEPASAPEQSVDERRAAVHEQGRAAIAEMQESAEPE
jgi:hypothetical protein